MTEKGKPLVGNGQRALWTFLVYTLVGPFFAALAVAAVLALAPPFGLRPLLPDALPSFGASVIATFVWSAVPSALCAAALVALVVRSGTFGPITAAAVGVIAFAIASVLFPIGLDEARPYLAFLAGLVSLAVRVVLVGAGILAT